MCRGLLQSGDTALHLAAASGLEQCVEALLAAGSPLFTENKAKLTPCDLAVKHGHEAIAHLLESKMVFVSIQFLCSLCRRSTPLAISPK